MSSILRIEASRANGAKSHGPVTEEGKLASAANASHATGPITDEGKARSSRNATRHGLLAHSITLPSESDAGFTDLLASLQEELQPVTHIESRLVENMAVADWRRMRLWCLEMAHYTHAIHIQERANNPFANEENNEIPSMHTALAFASLCDHSRSLDLLNRYEVRFSREYARTLADLKSYRAERLKAARELSEKSEISKRTEPNFG